MLLQPLRHVASAASERGALSSRARGLGVVHNSGIGTFAGTGIGVFSVGHVWLLFVLFQLACGTRRGRNPGTKKARRFRRASGLLWCIVVHGFIVVFVSVNTPSNSRWRGILELYKS